MEYRAKDSISSMLVLIPNQKTYKINQNTHKTQTKESILNDLIQIFYIPEYFFTTSGCAQFWLLTLPSEISSGRAWQPYVMSYIKSRSSMCKTSAYYTFHPFMGYFCSVKCKIKMISLPFCKLLFNRTSYFIEQRLISKNN